MLNVVDDDDVTTLSCIYYSSDAASSVTWIYRPRRVMKFYSGFKLRSPQLNMINSRCIRGIEHVSFTHKFMILIQVL
jgi:hypothetical protein